MTGKKEQLLTVILKKFFKPVKYLSKRYTILAILAAFAGAMQVYGMNNIKWATNAIQKGDIKGIYFLAGIYLFLLLIQHILGWIFKSNDRFTYIETVNRINQEYIQKLIYLDNNNFETLGTGKLIHVIKTGVYTWSELLRDTFSSLVGMIVALIFAFISIIYIGWQYVFIIILFVIINVLIFIFFHEKIQINKNERRKIWSESSRHLVKIIMSKFEILQQSKISKELKKMDEFTKREKEFSIKQDSMLYPIEVIPRIIVDLLRVGIIFFIGISAIKGTNQIGDVATMIGLVGLVDRNIIEFMRKLISMNDKFADIEHLWEILDESPKIKGYDIGNDFVFNKGDIEFSGLSFRYDSGNNVLNDFHLKIKGGKKTAIVGPSGCGKSTILKLIAGYINPNIGSIIVDNQILSVSECIQNIEVVSLKSYYPHIGYLTQEPGVFDGTIFENLIYGLTDKNVLADLMKLRVSEPEKLKKHPLLESIISLSKCEFIYNFPDGLATEIGEKGIKLSGGQKQRLAIAKIFLKNPNIILLDEPTSALDSYAEEEVSKALDNLFKDRTVIVVAHRFQTVKQADDIIVINDGKIIERGNHEFLNNFNGEYKKMLDLQTSF